VLPGSWIDTAGAIDEVQAEVLIARTLDLKSAPA